MVVQDLIRELEERGVRLSVEEGRLIARGRFGGVTPELSSRIQAHRDDLLRELTVSLNGTLSPLPEPLVRLVQAAIGNHLSRPGIVLGGLVGNVGEFVLACAAQYGCAIESDRQLERLWALRELWITSSGN